MKFVWERAPSHVSRTLKKLGFPAVSLWLMERVSEGHSRAVGGIFE